MRSQGRPVIDLGPVEAVRDGRDIHGKLDTIGMAGLGQFGHKSRQSIFIAVIDVSKSML